MALIYIRESPAGPAAGEGAKVFRGQVFINDGVGYDFTLSDPFDEAAASQLEWYFEEHLRQPFLNQVKARNAAQSIVPYGESLFNAVLADRDAYAEYAAHRAGLADLHIEIEGSPAFQALHWEALKDPGLPRALALEAHMVRRRRVKQTLAARVQEAPALRLLIVTARPHGPADVAYRTISRPLVEALRQADVRVDIDILRPGTYEALDKHLQAVRDEPKKGVGFYHVIHFDTHGGLLTHAQLQADRAGERLAFRYGRGNISPYEGHKAFLFFESEDGREADPVEAAELAALLTTHQIPITVLNACQSGKQLGEAETSLGSRLLEAGVQLVLAMGYSITVTAAEAFMRRLYEKLFDGAEVADAIRAGRQELFNRKGRRAYFNCQIDLEDWLLPVIYQNQPVRLRRRDFSPEEEGDYYERQAASFAEPATAYGFVGRDLDVLAIERRLLQHNLLLVRGMGGAGKSTLLKHLGHWWQSTDFVAEVFYFRYDEQGWTAERIVHRLAERLLGKAAYHGSFVALSAAAQRQRIVDALRGRRHLLILDNLESITGTHLAIAHGPSAAEQSALRSLLAALAGAKTLVLLGSRSAEVWLAQGTFGDHCYELSGLDPEAASSLAQRILQRYGVAPYQQEEEKKAFERLLKLLGGFPLALEVVLANLARQDPQEVLAALQAGDVDLDRGDAQSKTESIVRCIDYSHGNLSPSAQGLLECLAPFSGVVNVALLPKYTQALRKQALLAGLDFTGWPALLQAATDWGLLSEEPEVSGFMRPQPVLPYFLRARLNGDERAAQRKQIEAAYCELYDGYANAIAGLLRSNQAEECALGQALARLEDENLRQALQLGLSAQGSIREPYMALIFYGNAIHDEVRGLALGEQVLAGLECYSEAVLASRLGEELIGTIDHIAMCQLRLKRYDAAQESYEKALRLLRVNTSLPAKLKRAIRASICGQLGKVAEGLAQWQQAQEYYRKALEIFIEINDRHGRAGIYHSLSIVALKRHRWSEAENYCSKALDIFIECNYRHSQAGTYYTQGNVMQAQGQWPQAEDYYRKALEIFIEFDNRDGQSNAYYQLGIVVHKQAQWSQAEDYYRKALEIGIELNNRHSQSSAYHQLGIVAQELAQWPQAEDYYRKALEILIEFNDRHSQATTYHQLGVVAQAHAQWPQAEDYYRKALEIYIEFDDRYHQASTCYHLGTVAQAQRQWNEAMHRYLHVVENFLGLDDAPSEVMAALKNVARLWPQTADANLLEQVARIFHCSAEEAEALLRELL